MQPITGHLLSKRLRKAGKIPCKHLIVDTTPDPAVTNQIISEVDPDLTLIPIRHDDAGAHAQLDPLLQTIARMRAIGINTRVKILPLGGDKLSIEKYIDKDMDLPYEITETVPALPDIFGNAVYKDFNFAWNYDGCGYLYDIYRGIVLE